MKLAILLLAVAFFDESYNLEWPWPDFKIDPEVNMDAEQLITSKGYPFEEHAITTSDGYILTVHRIPGPRNTTKQDRVGSNGPVVLLQHGLLCDSTLWLLNLPDQNLPFMLADKGADVWLGNNRGNRYGRQHKSLSPDSQDFWNFSWDEMAASDLPAMINHILNHANTNQIFYIGHSEGTLIGFAGFQLMPSPPIQRFYALAPVATVGYIKSPIRLFAGHPVDFTTLFGTKDFLADPHGIFTILAKTLCNFSKTNPLCENILFVIAGSDGKNFNSSRIPVYVSHAPSSTSVQNMLHFAQMVVSKRFQMYDYGSPDGNMRRYNQSTPPIYDLTKMTVPTLPFTGGNDLLADPRDVLFLLSQLPNMVKMISIDRYDHLDFVWGIDANRAVFDFIVQDIIQQHRQNGSSKAKISIESLTV